MKIKIFKTIFLTVFLSGCAMFSPDNRGVAFATNGKPYLIPFESTFFPIESLQTDKNRLVYINNIFKSLRTDKIKNPEITIDINELDQAINFFNTAITRLNAPSGWAVWFKTSNYNKFLEISKNIPSIDPTLAFRQKDQETFMKWLLTSTKAYAALLGKEDASEYGVTNPLSQEQLNYYVQQQQINAQIAQAQAMQDQIALHNIANSFRRDSSQLQQNYQNDYIITQQTQMQQQIQQMQQQQNMQNWQNQQNWNRLNNNLQDINNGLRGLPY